MKEHLNFFDDLVMKMKTVDLKMDEEQMTMILLFSLPERCTGFTNSLIYARDTLTVEDVKSGLLSKGLRDQVKEISEGSRGGSSSHDLFVERGREDKRNWHSRWRSNSRKPGNGRRGKSKDGKCFICKKAGHWKKEVQI